MSQRRNTIELIEKRSELTGLIVRPLSARLFPPTIPEEEGIIDREKLLDVSGRSRQVQYRLVETYGLSAFDFPGGGCLLTDPIFSIKLRDLMATDRQCTTKDIELLTLGRHFRLSPSAKFVVARANERTNCWASWGKVRISPWTPSISGDRGGYSRQSSLRRDHPHVRPHSRALRQGRSADGNGGDRQRGEEDLSFRPEEIDSDAMLIQQENR
jgi:hypothetical protein